MYEHFNTTRLRTMASRMRYRLIARRFSLSYLIPISRAAIGVPFIEPATKRNRFSFPVGQWAVTRTAAEYKNVRLR